ncbi:hypothetical protein ACL9RL_09410 [Plantibacter sp. Mn2098]|uniref:hypothetical protein n=1 Tax=Plantibacter sp. Mn2098 TaxID=3395266 RepID=UPI003BCF0EDA
MTSPSVLDARAALVARLQTDPEGPKEWRQLPPPNAEFPAVFCSNDVWPGVDGPWVVSCDAGLYAADADDAVAVAAALTEAAMQARVLNAKHRVIALPASRVHFVTGPDPVLLVRMIEPGQEDNFRDGSRMRLKGLELAQPGFRWFDDGYEFEYLGSFVRLGDGLVAGTEQIIFAEVPCG